MNPQRERYTEHDGLLLPSAGIQAWWERSGMGKTGERWLNRIFGFLLLLFAFGWGYGISVAIRGGESAEPFPSFFGRSALRDPNALPTLGERLTENPLGASAGSLAPGLTRAAMQRAAREWASSLPASARGLSGAVYAQILPPEETPQLPAGGSVRARLRGGSGIGDQLLGSGIWEVVLQGGGLVETVPNQKVIRMVPLSLKQNGRIGAYRIGDWPCEVGRCPANPIYQTPRGLIEVTPQNQEIFLSEHIQLKDFITKLQEGVWPKYVVADPQLLDKLELVVQELERQGHRVDNLFAVSGFRSPWYNASGGNTAGRGELSRHMYGDAMDIAVDNDGNGVMDDLNGDGRISLSDAQVIGAAVDSVESRYPEMVGGMHYYPPTGGHQGMVHIDTRGNRARW